MARESARGHARIDDIEVLRAVAISMTLVGHAAELLFWGGPVVVWSAVALWGGVDLFFCISGFVIARGLLSTVPDRGGAANFIKFAVPFWIRRISRIWPAAFFWLVVALSLSFFFNKFGSFGPVHANLRDALAAVLHVANLHYLDCITWKNGSCYNLFGIYWSLSLEEQFYVIFPVVLFLLPLNRLAILLVFGVAAQFFLSRAPWSPMWAIRSDTLMLGVLIAIIHTKSWSALLKPRFLSRPVVSIGIFCVGVFLIAVVPYNMTVVTGSAADRPFVWFNTGLLAMICGAMVFVASFDQSFTLPNSRLKRILLYIGTRSYSLYLAHNPIFFLTREIFHRTYPKITFDHSYSLKFILVAGVLSLCAAELSYRFIETPLRRMGRKAAASYRSEHPVD